MMVMSDIEDPFVPMQSGLFVDPTTSKYVFDHVSLGEYSNWNNYRLAGI